MSEAAQQRIAFINHTGQVSGAESVLLSLLRGLDGTRFSPVVLAPENGMLRDRVLAEGLPFVTIPALQARFTSNPLRLLGYLRSLAQSIRALRRTIAEVDPDLIHANTVRAGIAATLATLGTRRTVIWHVQDILPRHPISIGIRTLALAVRRTRIIAVSRATAQAFAGGLPFGDRIEVIYNGTDLSRFPAKTANEPSTLKAELNIPQSSFLICTAGQITARKGLRELIDAFSRASAVEPGMHLAIAGSALFAHDQAYRDSLLAHVASTGLKERVHFLGHRSDLPAVLRSADLFVLNSRQEPFGLVLVESMSSGTPVLATRVGGIPEIVQDGVNGWLVEKDDREGLSHQLIELAREPARRAQAARTAQDQTCPRFSLSRFEARIDAYYRKISNRPRSAIRAQQPDRALGAQ